MLPSKRYESAGWIAPNGDYYGSSDPAILYLHLGLSTELVNSGIIPKSNNPDRWLELHGWLKQHGNVIVSLDSSDKERLITKEQIKTLCDIIGEEYMFLDFINQDKYISINELLDMDEWDLHYKLVI